jgi:hypothetical protein
MDAQHAPKNETETRVTPWVGFGFHGLSHYRIWKLFDGFRWFDRHEWRNEDGTIKLTSWLPDRVPGWPSHYVPAELEAA